LPALLAAKVAREPGLGFGGALAIGVVIPLGWLRWPIAAVLVSLGALRLVRHRHRHRRWTGMRLSMRGLTMWSFLMATAHGAGLMVVPVFMSMSMSGAGGYAHDMRAAGAARERHCSQPACMPWASWR
jgi:hypothetical protein